MTTPAAETKSVGLQHLRPKKRDFGVQSRPTLFLACLPAVRFFAHHLDYFIVTQNSHSSTGLGTVKTTYHDQTNPVHLPGLAKNAAPRHPSQAQGRLPPTH
jgi:hypothetical protein